jgi:hypothetical protein
MTYTKSTTYRVPRGPNREAYTEPDQQKKESTSKIRQNLRSECSAWFKQHIPGFFSTLGDQVVFPTAELLTLDQVTPFVRDPDITWPHYTHVLGLVSDLNVWESPQLPGIKLSYLSSGMGTPKTLVLAARESDFFPDSDQKDWERYGGRSCHAYVNRFQDFDPTFFIWILNAMVGELEEQYARARNNLAEIDLTDPARAAQQLHLSQREFLNLTRSASPAVSMLVDRLTVQGWILGKVYEFMPTRQTKCNDLSLFKDISKSLGDMIESGVQRE